MKIPTVKVLRNDTPVIINADDFDPDQDTLYEGDQRQKSKSKPKKQAKRQAPTPDPIEEEEASIPDPEETPWEVCCNFAKDGHEVAVAMKAAVEMFGLKKDADTLDKVAKIVNADGLEELRALAEEYEIDLHHAVKNPNTARERLFEAL